MLMHNIDQIIRCAIDCRSQHSLKNVTGQIDQLLAAHLWNSMLHTIQVLDLHAQDYSSQLLLEAF